MYRMCEIKEVIKDKSTVLWTHRDQREHNLFLTTAFEEHLAVGLSLKHTHPLRLRMTWNPPRPQPLHSRLIPTINLCFPGREVPASRQNRQLAPTESVLDKHNLRIHGQTYFNWVIKKKIKKKGGGGGGEEETNACWFFVLFCFLNSFIKEDKHPSWERKETAARSHRNCCNKHK